jgi:DNA-binding NarL/FixJ family response regulator
MDASKARVMLVDDHTMFRHAMEMLVNREADMEVFAEASDREEALSILKRERNIISMTY